jgi:hypothetical protein
MLKYKQSHDILRWLKDMVDTDFKESVYGPPYRFEYTKYNDDSNEATVYIEIWKSDGMAQTYLQFKGTYNIQSKKFEEYQPTTLMVGEMDILFDIKDKTTQKLMGRLLDKIILHIIHNPAEAFVEISAGEPLPF